MRLFRYLCALASIALIGVTSLGAQSFAGDTRVDDDTTGTMQGSPQIQVGPDGRLYVMWIDFRSGEGEIAMATSSDRGTSFTPTRIVMPGRSALAGMQRGAQFAIDRLGGIHVVFQERNTQGNVSAMYTRSTDAGATFSAPISVASDSGRFDQDFPSVAVDSAGDVYVAWVDNRDEELGTSAYTQLYFARSTDGGMTFSLPVRASNMPGGVGGSCECCNTAIATGPDGVVYIAFRGNVNNARDIHIARSNDRGETFVAYLAASSTWMIGACPMTGSSIAVDRFGIAHVVWRDSRQAASGREIVYYATLGPRDSFCTLDLQISDSPRRTNFPSIGVTRTGGIVVAWQDTRDDANDIRFCYSLDGGNSFGASDKLSNEPAGGRQELVSIAIGPDGTRYAVWQDLRRDEGDVGFARDTMALALVAPSPVTAIEPADDAVVTSAPVLAWTAPENLDATRQVSYDLSYGMAGETPMTVSGLRDRSSPVTLAPGQYEWRVVARTAVGEVMSETFSFSLQSSAGVREKDIAAKSAGIVAQPMPATSDEGASLVVDAASSVDAVIDVVDVTGAVVERVHDGRLAAGRHRFTVGRGLPAGYYRFRMLSGGAVHSGALIVR